MQQLQMQMLESPTGHFQVSRLPHAGVVDFMSLQAACSAFFRAESVF